jgi:hypothetical protein
LKKPMPIDWPHLTRYPQKSRHSNPAVQPEIEWVKWHLKKKALWLSDFATCRKLYKMVTTKSRKKMRLIGFLGVIKENN